MPDKTNPLEGHPPGGVKERAEPEIHPGPAETEPAAGLPGEVSEPTALEPLSADAELRKLKAAIGAARVSSRAKGIDLALAEKVRDSATAQLAGDPYRVEDPRDLEDQVSTAKNI